MRDPTCECATSTSVSLLYEKRPVLNFAAYVSRMERELRGCFEDTLRLTWDHDDTVVIDIDGSRVVMGYWETPVGMAASCQAVLVVSVGPGPDWRADTRLARYRRALCRSIVAAVSKTNPADSVLWRDFQGVFTTEDFDLLIDEAVKIPEQSTHAAPAIDPDTEAPSSEAASGRFGGLPVHRLMDRLETEIRPVRPRSKNAKSKAAKASDLMLPPPSAQAPVPEVLDAVVIANDLPDLPLPMTTEMDRIRLALYPPEPEATHPPLVQRLTVYTLNTTLMIVAMPVGAALLTYNILGGEDTKVTARAMALTGAVIGLTHSFLGQYMMLAV